MTMTGKKRRVRPRAINHYRVNGEIGNCPYCNVRMTRNRDQDNTVTRDHIIPKSRNGGHEIDNIILVCWACNNARGDLSVDEFKALLASGKVVRPDPRRREKNRRQALALSSAIKASKADTKSVPPETPRERLKREAARAQEGLERGDVVINVGTRTVSRHVAQQLVKDFGGYTARIEEFAPGLADHPAHLEIPQPPDGWKVSIDTEPRNIARGKPGGDQTGPWAICVEGCRGLRILFRRLFRLGISSRQYRDSGSR